MFLQWDYATLDPSILAGIGSHLLPRTTVVSLRNLHSATWDFSAALPAQCEVLSVVPHGEQKPKNEGVDRSAGPCQGCPRHSHFQVYSYHASPDCCFLCACHLP